MTEFFNALKADLLDRRLLPLVVLAAVALVGAIGYAVLAGGSSPATPALSPSVAATLGASSGIAATQATPEKAVAEVTSGGTDQRHGVSRNPFALLPEAVKAAAAANKAASSGSSPTGASTGGGGEATKSEAPSSTEKTPSAKTPSKPAKPKSIYHVAVLFGLLPAGVTPETATLTPFENLKLLSPLPSAQQALIVYRGVTAGGKSATFTVVSEAILHGNATCLPSATQCQAIDLAPGQTEQLEYISPTGEVSLYELRVVTIVSSKASTGAVKGVLRGESKAGRELLRHAGLTEIPFLHNSTQAGVLVFSGHGARVARAHAAKHARS
ncbi:MAG: hypothetical protein ACYDHN_06905 [Solirubrobacteraceae bacterium]